MSGCVLCSSLWTCILRLRPLNGYGISSVSQLLIYPDPKCSKWGILGVPGLEGPRIPTPKVIRSEVLLRSKAGPTLERSEIPRNPYYGEPAQIRGI